MINLIIQDKNRSSNMRKKLSKKENKYNIKSIIIFAAILAMVKVIKNHDNEITDLKKVIEEMQSKGE